MANRDIITAVKRNLCAYLKANMPNLADALDEFPNPSEKLKYPSLTVFTNSPTVTSIDPYVLSKGAKVTAPEDPNFGKTPIRYVVGSYDFKLQVDIWTAYKIARNQMYEEFYNAVNANISPMGLKLQLEDYFDSYADFHISGFKFMDSEGQSQRQEWRCKVDLVCTCNHIMERYEYVMEQIAVDNSTGSVLTDDGLDAQS